MNFLFTINDKYILGDSIDDIRTAIKSIAGRKWNDYTANISGMVASDNSFKLSPIWTLGSVRVLGGMNEFTYLTGKLVDKGEKTELQFSTRPNYALVAFFYFLPLLIILKLLGFNTFIDIPLYDTLIIFTILCMVLAGVMIFGVIRLRNRFKKLMYLK